MKELIICPKCDRTQFATVQYTVQFTPRFHDCEKCGYIIMKSQWERISVSIATESN